MFSGRLNRTSFLSGSAFLLIPILVSLAIFYAVSFVVSTTDDVITSMEQTLTNFIMLFVWLFCLALLPIYFGLMVRRLHDLNLTGWWSLLHLVPFINIAFFAYLLMVPGQTSANKYGEPLTYKDPSGLLFGKTYTSYDPTKPHRMGTGYSDVLPSIFKVK